MQTNYDVIVIGGGASGMMASIYANRNGYTTLVIDHNEKLGKKLYITGKGKCNLTNNSSIENHLLNTVTNSKFMYSALNAFSPQDTMEFFEENGLKLRTERGNRVFPNSDKSSDVIKTLERAMQRHGVTVSLNNEILDVDKKNDIFYIKCDTGITYTANSLIIATGGVSYAGTGATDFGYKLAKKFGHKVIVPKSALCPIVVKEDVSELNGLALRNISLAFIDDKKTFSEQGDMLFTFNSLTGPIALTLSSKINKLNLQNKKLYLDLKPALTEEKLDNKLQREFVEYAKKDYKNYLSTLLPASFIDFFMDKTKIKNKKISEMTKNDRQIIINTLKKFDFSIKSLDNINVSIVTSGGVDVKEINAKTCESKLVPNLYFVGEVLDVDALTGGYNLQIAWSTGYLAGNSLKG
ncbi:MAG: NAD(P)/FAD-dependent oxidoreductase [Clostridiales bacterium]|nr:NAD(P)/FAD-dependent oxidoreductase [Clostridiales bacterium]